MQGPTEDQRIFWRVGTHTPSEPRLATFVGAVSHSRRLFADPAALAGTHERSVEPPLGAAPQIARVWSAVATARKA